MTDKMTKSQEVAADVAALLRARNPLLVCGAVDADVVVG